MLISIIVSSPIAGAAGLAGSQAANAVVQAPVTDPRAVPLVVPSPPISQTQESGGGQALVPLDQDQIDDAGTALPELDLSPNAPRIRPALPQETDSESWTSARRTAADLCFVNDSWRDGQPLERGTEAAFLNATLNPTAALVALGMVLGNYWATQELDPERLSGPLPRCPYDPFGGGS